MSLPSALRLSRCLPLLAVLVTPSGGLFAATAKQVSVTISPTTATLVVGGSQAFTAKVLNAPGKRVIWSATKGRITSTGRYTAPGTPGTYTVKATLQDRRAYGTATVVVIPVQQAPVINSFYAAPGTITVGQGTTLSWNVSGATSLSISGVGPVTGSSITLNPTVTTTYTLTATNPAGTVTASATVTVNPAQQAPTITSFTATPSTLTAGQSTTLAWATTGATSLAISGIGTVTGTSLSASPTVTTTYTLTATNAAGSATAATTVTVNAAPQPPAISSFTATPSAITAGQSSTLAWNVVGATALSIAPGIGSVTGTSVSVSPSATTTYTLTASNSAGAKTATTTLTVTAAVPPGPCNGADLGPNANLHGFRPFPDSNPWNQDVSTLPVDPSSTAIINYIGATAGLKADFGSGLWDGGPIGIPYQVVDGAQPKVNITYTAYGSESDPGPMPVAASSPVEGGSASTGDRHVLIMDRDACLLYELYRAFPQANGTWNADSGTVWDLHSNANRPFGWTSADAAGLPLFPGLAKYDEVASGEVTHALRFTVPHTRKAYVLPATHWASSLTDAAAPPMGMRVRLKAGFDITPFPARVQVLLRGLKKYGMILADNGSAWFMSGAPDERWDNNELARFSNVKGSDLEVVQMGTVYTADPTGAAPAISAFTASPASITSGQSSTLSWTVTNATRVFVTPVPGFVTAGTSASVSPTATATYTLTAEGPYGVAKATVQVTVTTGSGPITPDDPGTADLRFTLDSTKNVHPISRWIYGYNGGTWDTSMAPGTTFGRLGGNRWTAYNWETNASNAGSDWNYSSDSYLSASSIPGEAVRPSVANAQAAGAGILVTVPIQGWVSKDENGTVSTTAPVSDRFLPNLPKKPSALSTTPDLTDGKVYQDEFVHWLDAKFPTAKTDAQRPVFFSLDNEPDLWNSTHLEIQRAALRYDELIPKTLASAAAIKDALPQAVVFGPVSYGYNGFVNLQNAPDNGGRDFVETYLAQVKAASTTQGRRLVDVLDLHWYSEAQGGGQRVVGGDNSDPVAQARMQAPRSLWDATYTETSWITQWVTLGPIKLLPSMNAKIAANFPGTSIALTEYNHGGEDHISGGIAQADCLGIFGRDGVFAANVWPMSTNRSFSYGAFRAFRNFDGSGAAFGNTSFQAQASDAAKASVYGSVDAGNPDRVVVVLINKASVAQTAGLALTHSRLLTHAQVYQLTSASPIAGGSAMPQRQADLTLTLRNALRLTLPAQSVTTLVLLP